MDLDERLSGLLKGWTLEGHLRGKTIFALKSEAPRGRSPEAIF